MDEQSIGPQILGRGDSLIDLRIWQAQKACLGHMVTTTDCRCNAVK